MGWYWPKVNDLSNSEKAAHDGAKVCFFIAGITSIIAIASIYSGKPILGVNKWAFLDGAIFAFSGWRIWKFSRVWAVLALIIYVVERVYAFVVSPRSAGTIMTVIFTFILIGTIRGTFAYHQLKKKDLALSAGA